MKTGLPFVGGVSGVKNAAPTSTAASSMSTPV